MNIIKIGGILLSERSNYCKFRNFIEQISKPNFIVISAIGKTTRLLQKASYLAFENNYDNAKEIIGSIKNLHILLANSLFGVENDVNIQLNNVSLKIDNLIKGIYITKELNNKIIDKIISKGEVLSSIIMCHFLKRNDFPVSLLNAEDYIITDNNFGSANPIFDVTKKRLESIELGNKIYLIAGFYGSTLNREITTMGYESSNLTAALLASVFDVNSVTIITDVDCIYSADPKIIKNPIPVKKISSRTAQLLSKSGLKLIHRQMIEVIENKDILLTYTSLNRSRSTIIDPGYTDVSTPIICYNDSIENDSDLLLLNRSKPTSYVAIANVNSVLLMKIIEFLNSKNLTFAINYSSEDNFLVLYFNQQLTSELLQHFHEIIIGK